MRVLIVATAALLLAGCSTYSTSRYSISADNVVALRSLKNTPVQVGQFTSTVKDSRKGTDLQEIMCRGVGPIKTPDGESFANYIRKALIDEMKIAEVYSTSSPVTISGNLDSINFSSNGGHWDAALTLKSSNGKTMVLNETYPYQTSFYGETACNQTAQAFMPAIQDLVGKAVKSPEFATLMSH
ncbi:hypothetical protein [Paralcaligenes ginsengisoli]